MTYRRLLFSFFIGCAMASGQSYYGTLRGNVVDPNGGVIAVAKVTMTNQGTSETRSAITASAGEFVFSEVVPATYSLVVEAAGFKKFERSRSWSVPSSRFLWTPNFSSGR